MRIIDTYGGHGLSEEGGSKFEKKLIGNIEWYARQYGKYFPSVDKFMSAKQLSECRDINNGSLYVKIRVIMSLGRFIFKGKFRFENKNNQTAQNAFYELNEGIIELINSGHKLPRNSMCYAIMPGYKIDEMTQKLETFENYFDGIKIPAFTPIPANHPDFESLWDLCEKNKWPVLVHCSKEPEEPLNFQAVYELAKKRPNLLVTASHMGGDNEELFSETVQKLKHGNSPENLFLNTAIYETKLLRIAMNQQIGSDRIVYATDFPFFNPDDQINEIIRVMGDNLASRVLYDNGLLSLGLK